MTDFDIEVVRYCAETNGPCWECSMHDQCKRWKEERGE